MYKHEYICMALEGFTDHYAKELFSLNTLWVLGLLRINETLCCFFSRKEAQMTTMATIPHNTVVQHKPPPKHKQTS